ncbi:MAG: DUF1178 family protein [Burkholderiaceae bacterium]
MAGFVKGLLIMKVFNLQCSAGHRFEGWFKSSESCEDQRAQRLLTCPVCDGLDIVRLPSAPHIQTSTSALNDRSAQPSFDPAASEEAPASGRSQPAPVHSLGDKRALVQQRLLELARALVESADDVGRDFPEEARRIHYQEAPERMIMGQATAEETQALQDEGIEVVSLPFVAKPGSGKLQ